MNYRYGYRECSELRARRRNRRVRIITLILASGAIAGLLIALVIQ